MQTIILWITFLLLREWIQLVCEARGDHNLQQIRRIIIGHRITRHWPRSNGSLATYTMTIFPLTWLRMERACSVLLAVPPSATNSDVNCLASFLKRKYYNNVNLLLGSPPGQVRPQQQQAEDLLVRHVRVSLAECAQLQRQHLLVRSQHL